jgi:hypothetical protein
MIYALIGVITDCNSTEALVAWHHFSGKLLLNQYLHARLKPRSALLEGAHINSPVYAQKSDIGNTVFAMSQ